MECYRCKNKVTRYKKIDFYTIWFCDCGQSGIVQFYPKCCNNPDLVEIQSETSDHQRRRRKACKTCKAMSGKALPKGNDFKSLPLLSYEKNIEYDLIRSRLFEKCKDEVKKYIDEFEAIKYDQYLQTDIWKKKSDIVKRRDNYLCQMCLINKATEAHHITYQRKYNELTSDLISVCNVCHKKIHNIKPC